MSDTLWRPEHPAGHEPFCASPHHSLTTYCRASELEPQTLKGEPSQAWLRDHPAPTAEDVLEELVREARRVPSNQFPDLLRRAYKLGRAYELARAAHHAARALEELGDEDLDPDGPSATEGLTGDWGPLGGGRFAV